MSHTTIKRKTVFTFLDAQKNVQSTSNPKNTVLFTNF